MFIVLLKFSSNKSQAGSFMEGHNTWIKKGIDDGVFMLVGSLEPNLGGCILANNLTLETLQNRVNNDPFVSKNVVTAEILEVSPKLSNKNLKFLLD